MSMGRGWPAKKISSGAWWYCARSGVRANLDDMIWEQGILVAPEFSDVKGGGGFGLLGSRDADVARRIAQNTSDLMPHPKLSVSSMPEEDVEFDA
jgi:hypothetical protein